jgi:organic anion transporter 3A
MEEKSTVGNIGRARSGSKSLSIGRQGELTAESVPMALHTTGPTAATSQINSPVSDPEKVYGRDIKDIPKSMWKLLSNPVYVVTCLGACMELVIVSGFLVFLPKYLETQFSLTKSQASVFTGGIAIPGASVGIFMGGIMLKRFQLKPKGALGLVIAFNALCLACYSLLFLVGCNNVQMAGTTLPYYFNTEKSEVGPSLSPMPLMDNSGLENKPKFEINLTAACNFGCDCSQNDVEPVCGGNGVTYFSPCHAGCTSLSSQFNYSNCACKLSIHKFSGWGNYF